jgi:hypothetical protein
MRGRILEEPVADSGEAIDGPDMGDIPAWTALAGDGGRP